ncbi:MAG: UDP-N-acetylmuramoyl-L-alanine--D-glutamate ligase [Fidelibacterota bacterium]
MDISHLDRIKLKNKNVTVIGAGRSGLAASRLAHYLGANVFISDKGWTKDIIELKKEGIRVETNGHSDSVYDADLWVISPGIPKDSIIVRNAQLKNIPIVGEIEFASWFTRAPIIAITGSNGKTTTAHMMFEMCKTDDLHPILSGNVGKAFSEVVLSDCLKPDDQRIHVLEISSFQMEFIHHFKPYISLFLNLTPDHLNRYDDMDDYVATKMKMWSNQTENDYLVFNADDPLVSRCIEPSKAIKIPYSLNSDAKGLLFRLNATKIYDQKHATLIILDEIALPGRHNLSNYLGSSTSASLLGIASSRIAKVMSTFCGVPHRLEHIGKIDGVIYINDSKATNIEAVKVALDSFDQPILLILGGRDKGGDFLSLYPHTHKKVKEVLTIGESEKAITTVLEEKVKIKCCNTLSHAVEIAHSNAQPGDIVLLSPGCASFDQFANFEERGDSFRELVQSLKANG